MMDLRINTLLEKLRKHPEAMNELYEHSKHGVYAFILATIKDYQLAEDIMQETYLKVYQNIRQYKNQTNGINWILTIARNTALTMLVRKNREEQVDPQTEEYRFPSVKETIIVSSPTIELAKKILDEQEQQIVYLFAIAQYKHREIALMLDLPLGTVTWKYSEAIKKLRKEMEGKHNEG